MFLKNLVNIKKEVNFNYWVYKLNIIALLKAKPFKYEKEFSNVLNNIKKFAQYEKNTNSLNKISASMELILLNILEPLIFEDSKDAKSTSKKVNNSTKDPEQLSKLYRAIKIYS